MKTRPKTQSLFHKLRQSGFSLVEVTLALGIVAFALIPLLALVPIGLTAANASMRQTAQANILQKISGDISMLSFADLNSYLAETYYYDGDGRLVDTPEAAIYGVTLTRKNAVYPGSDNAADLNIRLQQVVVEIGHPTATSVPKTRSTLTIAQSAL